MSTLSLEASVLGLLDTGADPNHQILSRHLRINLAELRGKKKIDDDKNGYVDDVKGWNFIEESPRPFDEKLYGKFGEVFYKYYRIREKRALETWSKKEEAWYIDKRSDKKFLEELKKFRSYIHGSHVLGIALGGDRDIQFINVKYLGKASKGRAKEPVYIPLQKGAFSKRLIHLKKFIIQYNTWQELKLSRAIDYVAQKSDVVNGSWGKSYKSSVKVITKWYKREFQKAPSEKLSDELAKLFLSNLISRTEQVTSKYPKVLFVFSAGNTKSNNDEFPHYPSDARGSNIIAVGAAWENKRTNSSNFGKLTVDLFAPGFLIASTTPENRVIKTTGTSQAAPKVAHAALVIKNINNKLVASQIREILLGTADKNSEFISISGGLLNLPRALSAAKLSLRRSISKSIKESHKLIKANSYNKGLKRPKVQDDPLLEAF